MKLVDIFQTLEYRGNEDEVKKHGPYLCALTDAHGNRKTGIKEPWLGEGYYFWDTNIADARWWGENCYKSKGYIIWMTKYDQHSPFLFDMVGDISQANDFFECAKYIREYEHKKKITFPYVFSILKKFGKFEYKAVRVWPYPLKNSFNSDYCIKFPGATAAIIQMTKIQICFFDTTLLALPFDIAERSVNTISTRTT